MHPDVPLLTIFDFFLDEGLIEAWRTLVHVCRTWRAVVFGSARRLDLRLHCKASTPVKETLYVWPHFPIVIKAYGDELRGADNIIAALERNDRIREMSLFDFQSSQFEKVSAAMQQPFPALTDLALELELEDESAQVVPASFPGGSAPRLQILTLYSFPFPGLPKLLLSATHLVDLDLWNIPDAGYISPTEMVICLSVLTGLEKLELGFESPLYPPDRRIRPPPTRAFLPVLTGLRFFGVCDYLEDLVAWIDAPLMDKLAIIFFHRLMFTTPKLTEFISRTSKFEPHNEALVVFSEQGVSVTLLQTFDGLLELGISCTLGMAAFVSGPGLQLVPPTRSLCRGGTPLHPREWISGLAR